MLKLTRLARPLIGLVAVGVLAVLLAPPRGPLGMDRAKAATNPIKHIVFVVKENRSFDHYFGRFPGVNGTRSFRCYRSSNPSISDRARLPRAPEPMPQDVAHANFTWLTAFHDGKNDGFCHEGGAIVKGSGQDIADTQFREPQIQNYWGYARTYGLGDRMFASWRGASFANNVFAVAAQSGRYSTTLSRRAIFGNPQDPMASFPSTWGCDNSAGTSVTMINLQGVVSGDQFPCFTFDSIPKLLERNGLNWAFYGNQEESQWVHSGIAALRNIRCLAGEQPPCTATNTYWNSHVKRGSQITTDAAAGTLPSVSWFVPLQNEHPPKTACKGENAVVDLVNAVMSGPQWRSTAIVVWWDEWGGFYDHVPPPTAVGRDDGVTPLNAYISYGFRVPLLVISPWVKDGTTPGGGTAPAGGGYVSHKFYSHASFARFVEWAFGLPTLGAADDLSKYTAAEPKPGNLSDFFDLSDTTPNHGKLALTTRDCPTLSPALGRLARAENPD